MEPSVSLFLVCVTLHPGFMVHITGEVAHPSLPDFFVLTALDVLEVSSHLFGTPFVLSLQRAPWDECVVR